MTQFTLPQNSFLLLLGAVTLAFFWILLPFSGAVFWGMVLAIVFAPVHARLLAACGQRPNVAAFATLMLIVLMVILPVTLIAAALVDQALSLYAMVSAGSLDFDTLLRRMVGGLPGWASSLFDRYQSTIMDTVQDKLSAGIAQASQLAARYAVNLGRNALGFLVSMTVMLYLLFFLFRDGRLIAARIKRAVPLDSHYKKPLFDKFVTVIRATVKGNVLVAVAQGTLGGLIFWFLDVPGPVLWGVVMSFLSLLPAVGAGLIWGPVAAYFLFTGSVTQGVVLALYGVLVIGLVDNVLRPILVGKDTKLPDYLVLLSTLGGMALFGLNGFVIGPVIAALFISAWSLFSHSDEFQGE